MRFHRFIIANLLNRPLRTILTTFGVAVAISAVVSLVGISDGFENSLRQAYENRGIDLLVLQKGQLQHVSSRLPDTLEEQVAVIPGVDKCEPMLIDVTSLDESQMFGVQLQGWRLSSFFFEQLDIIEGEKPESAGHKEIVVGEKLAEGLGKLVGDKIELLEDEAYTIVGIYTSPNVFETGWIIMPLEDLQEFMMAEGEVTGYAVVAQNHDRKSLEAIRDAINKIDTRAAATIARDFAENASELKIAGTLAWMTSSIALVVGALAVLNTMLMTVFERTHELAVMRALGWRKQRVLTLVLAEALALTVIGAALGNLMGAGVVKFLSLSESGGRVVDGSVSPIVFLQGFAVAVALGLLGGLYPAWRAANLEPIDGLRHE
ncbi:MAG: ABC transporter permease [Planctomycetales bacterium]|nr:ABC transporter permease [Planctomycetales bacterium]